MADSEHLAILKQGVDAWNEWRKTYPDLKPDLTGADLQKADLTNVDFSLVNLTHAKLWLAKLTSVNLSNAVLVGAELTGADLIYAKAKGADLTGAVLTQAFCYDVDLSDANLTGAYFDDATLRYVNVSSADFMNANFGFGVLASLDLSGSKNLETVNHSGPSTIGIDTLYQSNGQIPESFLRGAGVPDSLITYAKSLLGSAIEFYSCFISYSTNDQNFAERLYADLQANDVRCWFAPHDAQSGRKLHEQIDEAIRLHEKLLLILSLHSMKSEWVKMEIAKARKRELRENIQVLFPVRLVSFEQIRDWECFDADTGKDSAREIREYFVADFRNWKDHDAYQHEFDKLLRDLNTTKARPKVSG